MECKPCCDRTQFQHEKHFSLELNKWLCVSRRPAPAPVPQLTQQGCTFPAEVKTYVVTLLAIKYITKCWNVALEPNSWWIIWEFPDLCQWGGGARVTTTCALVGGSLTLRHHLFFLADFSGTFPHKLTGAIAFLALLHPFSSDSFRHKTGKENHPHANRAVAPHTTRCPSATNCLFPLIHSLLPCHEQNYKAFHQFQPYPLLKPTLTSSGSWQTTANCWVLGSVPASPPASPPGTPWQAVLARRRQSHQSHRHSRAGLCRSSDCSRSRR